MSGLYLQHPWALALLLVAPALAAVQRRGARARSLALRVFTGASVPLQPRGRAAIAASVLLALAAARPTLRSAPPSRPQGGDLVILLDVSRSMLAGDVAPSRLARARSIASALVGQLHADRAALIVFAGAPAMISPLTADFDYVRAQLQTASPYLVARGGTDIAAALRFAGEFGFDNVRRSWKAVVLLSDGGEPDGGAAVAAAEALEQRGIPRIAIGMGSASGAIVPVSETDPSPFLFQGRPVGTSLDAIALRRLSTVYVRSEEFDAAAVYGALTAAHPLSDSPLQRELYPLLAALAFALLALEWIPRRRKPIALPRAFAASFAVIFWQTSAPAPNPPDSSTKTPAQWVELGTEQIAKGQAKEAVDSFEAAQRLAPDTPEIEFDLAVARYESQEMATAGLFFEQAARHARNPGQKAHALFGQGNAEYRLSSDKSVQVAVKHCKQAIDLYTEVLGIDPEFEDATFNREVARQKLAELSQQAAGNVPRGEPRVDSEDTATLDPGAILRQLEKRRPIQFPERVEHDW